MSGGTILKRVYLNPGESLTIEYTDTTGGEANFTEYYDENGSGRHTDNPVTFQYSDGHKYLKVITDDEEEEFTYVHFHYETDRTPDIYGVKDKYIRVQNVTKYGSQQIDMYAHNLDVEGYRIIGVQSSNNDNEGWYYDDDSKTIMLAKEDMIFRVYLEKIE